MDIISYGAASKERRRAETLAGKLGDGVEGTSENLQDRLKALTDSMDDVTRLADNVIVRDAVNLMKAEARLNTIVQAKKYGMDHMVFDDLLDLSGIDTVNSTGYVHDAVKGEIKAGINCEIEIKDLNIGGAEKLIVVIDEKASRMYQDITPRMTSNTSPPPIKVSSKIEYVPSYYAFDSSSTLWESASLYESNIGNSSWIKIDFGESNLKRVDKYSFMADSANTTLSSPKDWIIEGSNTGSFSGEQVIVDSKSNIGAMGANQVKEYQTENPGEFRYYRFNFIRAGVDGRKVVLKEIKMYESYEGDGKVKIMISSDGGVEWNDIEKDSLSIIKYQENSLNDMRLKFLLPETGKILSYGLIWT